MEFKKQGLLQQFKSDVRGNVAMIFGFLMIVVSGTVAIAIDFGRASNDQHKMQAASDAAALAAARSEAPDRVVTAREFFNARYSNTLDNTPRLLVEVDSTSGTVTLNASSNVPTTFMRLFGVDRIAITSMSKVGASIGAGGNKLEVAMMIDLTGSMGATRNGMTKIDALKAASADLINIFFPNNTASSETTRVAIAPMADYVNAGQYASEVTGLDPRGPFSNLTNLKSTKHGPFSGSHAGSITGGAAGSQHGATSPSSTLAGATYDNGHCANPNAPGVPIAQATHNDYPGTPVGATVTGTGTAPSQLMAAGGAGFYEGNALDNVTAGFDWELMSGTASDGVMGQAGGAAQMVAGAGNYYIPIPATAAGVTYMTDPSTGKLIGVPAFIADSALPFQPQLQSASAGGGYVQITGFSNGSFTLASGVTSTGYFIPVPASMSSTGGTLPECSSNNNPNDGYLISCVTERSNASHRNDDTLPGSGDFLGPYNQKVSGATSKLNYSEDGLCMTAGRELPAVIPLTNQRAALENFFANATIGGSTPGHLGHAWAWYMLSPKWNSIWPSASQTADYNDPSVTKAAIIMTDGEYNTQYTDETSKTQALALCNGMRQAGIQVYTIGFGFAGSAADTAAADTLKQCANNETGKYFLAYDHNALSQAFQSIGQQLKEKQMALKIMN